MTRGRRSASAVVAVVTGSALVAGCAGAPAPGAAAAGVEHRGVVVDLDPGDLTAADVATAQTAFGLDLLQAVCARMPGENVLLSPASAAGAVGLLQPAADGETADAIAQVLQLPDWSPDLAAALHEHTAAMAGLAAPGDSVRISSQVWTDSTVNPTRAYLDAVATAYDAGLESLDFGGDPGGSTSRINEAIAVDTAGLVPRLFEEPLGTDTQVVLTNAVHLDARWATEFDDATPGSFRTTDGDVVVDMMSGGDGTVTTSDGWSRVEMPYRDGTLAAVAVLPPEGVDPCTTDVARLGALDAAASAGSGAVVSMPTLRLEQTHELLDVLAQLGLPVAGEFAGFGANGPLEITGVVQKAVMELDEAGTEAAAATGVVLAESATVAEQVRLDRPFLLLLTDVATASPLFLGVVHDPSA